MASFEYNVSTCNQTVTLLQVLTTGTNNTALGFHALNSNGTGSNTYREVSLKRLQDSKPVHHSLKSPIAGSVSNIIVVQQAREFGVRISFRDFARLGVPVTLVALAGLIGWAALI